LRNFIGVGVGIGIGFGNRLGRVSGNKNTDSDSDLDFHAAAPFCEAGQSRAFEAWSIAPDSEICRSLSFEIPISRFTGKNEILEFRRIFLRQGGGRFVRIRIGNVFSLPTVCSSCGTIWLSPGQYGK